jgi:sulfur carrier protein
MIIQVNGREREVAARTLAALLEELDYGDQPVATALNRDFIRAKERGETALKEGDSIEIVAPRQGG